jgi:hypothetical protein
MHDHVIKRRIYKQTKCSHSGRKVLYKDIKIDRRILSHARFLFRIYHIDAPLHVIKNTHKKIEGKKERKNQNKIQ